MTVWAEVAERIEADDAAGVVETLLGLSETQRRSLAAEALAQYRRDDLNAVAGLAVLATGAKADVDRLWAGVVSRHPDACVDILAARRPSWLETWVTARCERDPRSTWRLARALRLQGLYGGDSPAYALAFIAGIGTATYDRLLADRSLLDDELWRAFEIEGGGDTSFAAHDKYTPAAASWSVGLRRLADEGVIDRQRLIDATLDALARGYSAFRAGWFVRFHSELDLTNDEQKARIDRYLDLLGSPTSQVQSFAVKAVAALEKFEPLPGERLIGALRPAVLNPANATASQALRLVDAAARRTPGASRLGALVAAEALLHEAPDIQARALTIVERNTDNADPELAAALAAAVPVVAPSLRSRLATLVRQDATSERDINDRRPSPTKPTVAFEWPESMLDATVLDSAQPVAPIETTAELAMAVARALEHPEEIDNVEQAIGGISRLCGVSHAEPAAIWAPLRKRAERHLREHAAFDGRGLATDFAALVAAWLDQTQPPRFRRMGFRVMGDKEEIAEVAAETRGNLGPEHLHRNLGTHAVAFGFAAMHLRDRGCGH